LVNDAAASTVGVDPPVLADVVVADAELDVVAADDEVELELLPHAAATADTAIAIIPTETRRATPELITTTTALSGRQNPGTLTESWQ
jgi:hypothetical protein